MNTNDILVALRASHQAILAAEPDIESLDRAIGDGDHYINISRGFEVIAALHDELVSLPPSQVFQKIGMKLLSTIGGASGPLISSLFLAMGKSLDGVAEPDRAQFALAFTAGVDAIRSRGKADLGEKTMLDVLIPVARLLQRLSDDGTELPSLCARLVDEAERGMLATRDMIATKGRASFLGERAVGHIDPGSKTSAVVIAAVCATLTA